MTADDLTFSYMGAFTSFVAFQTSIGHIILRKIYNCLAENERSDPHPASSKRAAGYGYLANDFIQAIFVVLGDGLIVGTCEEVMQGKSIYTKRPVSGVLEQRRAEGRQFRHCGLHERHSVWGRLFGDGRWISWGCSKAMDRLMDGRRVLLPDQRDTEVEQ